RGGQSRRSSVEPRVKRVGANRYRQVPNRRLKQHVAQLVGPDPPCAIDEVANGEQGRRHTVALQDWKRGVEYVAISVVDGDGDGSRRERFAVVQRALERRQWHEHVASSEVFELIVERAC